MGFQSSKIQLGMGKTKSRISTNLVFGKGMEKMRQKIGLNRDFSHQKYNWEWEKLNPKYHHGWDLGREWEMIKFIMEKGNGKLV